MSDDLDDGEIPKEAPVGRFALTGKGDKIDRWEPASSVPRNRYSDDRSGSGSRASATRDAPEDRRERSRSRRWSPARDDRYVRRRTPPPRPYDRYSAEANSGAPRARFSGARKEPSVHDANTRADLGRLAREAEAAAYKARTQALAKSQSSTQRSQPSSSPRPSQSNNGRTELPKSETRKRSRSPVPKRHSDAKPVRSERSSSRGLSRPLSPRVSRDRLSVSASQANRITRDTSRHDSIRRDAPSKNTLTPADIGRLEREKEAAAYKAAVLQESQRPQAPPKVQATDSVSARSSGSDMKAHPQSNNKVSQEQVKEKPKAAELSRPVKSITPGLESQIAALKEEYEMLIKSNDKKQSEMRIAMRKWLKCEQDVAREAYKSELAQKSLEATISAL